MTGLRKADGLLRGVAVDFDMLHLELVLKKLLQFLVGFEVLFDVSVGALIVQAILNHFNDFDNLLFNQGLLVAFALSLGLRSKCENLLFAFASATV